MKKIICLLGIPGSGKTTFGNILKDAYSFPFYEEKFDGISSVTKERESTASGFEKCIGFLNMRYMQMQKAQSSEGEMTFVDTCFEMTEIYSGYLLKEDEYLEFKNTFDIINKFVPKPDLYINLIGDVDIILKRAIDRNLGVDLENTYLNSSVLKESSEKIASFLKGKQFIEFDITKNDLRDKDTVDTLVKKIQEVFV